MNKIVYSYDKITKVYTGEYKCQIDPVEKTFLIPKNCLEESPILEDGKVSVMVDGKWINKTNNIGKYYVDKSDNSIKKINELGDFDYILTNKQLSELNSGKLAKIENNQIVIYKKDQTIQEKIIELEKQITIRRLTEATLGDEDSIIFLKNIQNKIAKLRKKL